MKRVASIVTVVAGAVCGVVLAAAPASAAIPTGVFCAGMTCVNSTSVPQVVHGTAVCPTGSSLPVNALIEPLGVRVISVVCPMGAQPMGISF
ncbi:hypothetical protein OHA40_22025 [Nocardia sp. NBC_00508]|uniref:hypothetical protein n=1 Tax=Nocardia sp. NBC_00508 TaxID=2975992 RepID=UPI002E80A885|nr:hypothetical protein [Nocardia sp. NBC_00508]WUD64371.1 hypothetical protein OHA40_22025 [Nocardia sp. NBC_00508]